MLMFAAGNKMYEVYLHYLSSYGVANMDVGSHNVNSCPTIRPALVKPNSRFLKVLFDQDWDKIGPGALIDWGIYETGDASKPPDWGVSGSPSRPLQPLIKFLAFKISWYTPHRLIAHLEYMCN